MEPLTVNLLPQISNGDELFREKQLNEPSLKWLCSWDTGKLTGPLSIQ